MSVVYLLALAAVALALVVVTVSAMASVSRRPEWERPVEQPQLQLVKVDDRRHHDLPFVGKDRRLAGAASHKEASEARKVSAA